MITVNSTYSLIAAMGEAKATTQPDWTVCYGKKTTRHIEGEISASYTDDIAVGTMNDTSNVVLLARSSSTPGATNANARYGVSLITFCNRDTIAHTISISYLTVGAVETRIVNLYSVPANGTMVIDEWGDVEILSPTSLANTETSRLLSGSTNGKGIKVAATATLGTTIHTAVSGTISRDMVRLYVVNTSALDVKLTVEWGQGTAPDGNIEMTVRAEDGFLPITPPEGLPLNNGLVATAFAATGNVLVIYGSVTRVTA